MKVSELMSRVVVSVQDQDSLLEVLYLLDQHQISGMPVFNDGGQLVGVISRQDLCHPHILNHLRSGNMLDSLPIKDIKDFNRLITVQETDSVEQAAFLMSENKIHRVVVTNRIGNLIGILTTYDITKLKASEQLIDYDHPDLTDFDKQFIRLMILHKTEKEMADVFHIGENDVYEFIRHIQKKLGARERNQIIARALELNLF